MIPDPKQGRNSVVAPLDAGNAVDNQIPIHTQPSLLQSLQISVDTILINGHIRRTGQIADLFVPQIQHIAGDILNGLDIIDGNIGQCIIRKIADANNDGILGGQLTQLVLGNAHGEGDDAVHQLL